MCSCVVLGIFLILFVLVCKVLILICCRVISVYVVCCGLSVFF